MARSRGKNGKSSTPVATTLLMPPPETVLQLLKAKKKSKEDVGEITSALGGKISAAVEKKHVDKRALAIAGTLFNLPDEKLHVTYVHLMEYLTSTGVVKRALAQGELFERAAAAAPTKKGDGEEDEEEDGDGKVVAIGSAARKVAEAAGADA